MLCSLFPRGIFLISCVVVSHLLVLLGLLSTSFGAQESLVPGVLMVGFKSERENPSSLLRSSARQQQSTLSKTKNQSSTEVDGASSPIANEDIGRSTEGRARQALHSPKPHYPLVSRRLREQGLVVVRLCVNDQGEVGEAVISRSSGFPSLDESALKTLSQWRFSSSASGSTNLFPQCFQTPVQFTLES